MRIMTSQPDRSLWSHNRPAGEHCLQRVHPKQISRSMTVCCAQLLQATDDRLVLRSKSEAPRLWNERIANGNFGPKVRASAPLQKSVVSAGRLLALRRIRVFCIRRLLNGVSCLGKKTEAWLFNPRGDRGCLDVCSKPRRPGSAVSSTRRTHAMRRDLLGRLGGKRCGLGNPGRR